MGFWERLWTWLKEIFAEMQKVKEPQKPVVPPQRWSPDWYADNYKSMTFDPGFEQYILTVANRVKANQARYAVVAAQTGVPWYFIGAIHMMESSCDFRGCLHNGERIIGTGLKTTMVPAGRGPFATWEESAIDALKFDGIAGQTDWSVGQALRRAEAYNGWGYKMYHPEENSPYVWACTSVNDGRGKYVADGKWDANANANTQVGVAAIFRQLEMLGAIKLS